MAHLTQDIELFISDREDNYNDPITDGTKYERATTQTRDGSYKPTPYASNEEDEDMDKFSGRRQCMEAWERNK